MSVIITLSVSAEEFALAEVLRRPGVNVRLESAVPVGDGVLPSVHVRGLPPDRVRELLSTDDDVESVEIVESGEESALANVTWDGVATDGLLAILRDADVAVLRGAGEGGIWNLKLRFADSDRVSEFHRHCRERGVSLTLRRVRTDAQSATGTGTGAGLTGKQCETLVEAYSSGYFDVPRKASLVDLAEQLAVSDNAVSERLRRGTRKLVESVLIDSGDDDGSGNCGSRPRSADH